MNMTYKEWNAIVMMISAVVIGGWMGWQFWQGGPEVSISEGAWQVLWAIGYLIAFNIVAIVLISIIYGIVRGGEPLADEASDERDRSVDASAAHNAYLALSIGILGVLIGLALGIDPALAPYGLFAVCLLSGLIHAASQFIYYRIG